MPIARLGSRRRPRSRRPVAVVALAVAALWATTAPAWAAHQLGNGPRAPYFTGGIADGRAEHSPVYAVLVPLGSDVPRDAVVAAKAMVSANACSLDNFVTPPPACGDAAAPSSVRRVQIDRLELDYVGPGPHHIYTSVGPVNAGSDTVSTTTPGQQALPCGNQLAVRLYVSVRYQDNSLSRYGVSGPPFTRC